MRPSDSSTKHYGIVRCEPRVGYTVAHHTSDLFLAGKRLDLFLPYGDCWGSVAFRKCVKVSRWGERHMAVSVVTPTTEKDDFGRGGLVQAHVALVDGCTWHELLRNTSSLTELLRTSFRDDPGATDEWWEMILPSGNPQAAADSRSYPRIPANLRYRSGIDRLRCWLGWRVRIPIHIHTPEDWESYADYVFQLARFASRAAISRVPVTFTTLALTEADGGRIVGVLASGGLRPKFHPEASVIPGNQHST